MNSMSNLPQIYQDIMRSPFAVAAVAAHHLAHNNQSQQQQSMNGSRGPFLAPPNGNNSPFNNQHQNTMAAMVASMAAAKQNQHLHQQNQQPNSQFVAQLQHNLIQQQQHHLQSQFGSLFRPQMGMHNNGESTNVGLGKKSKQPLDNEVANKRKKKQFEPIASSLHNFNDVNRANRERMAQNSKHSNQNAWVNSLYF
jgi:hypothetical protein